MASNNLIPCHLCEHGNGCKTFFSDGHPLVMPATCMVIQARVVLRKVGVITLYLVSELMQLTSVPVAGKLWHKVVLF